VPPSGKLGSVCTTASAVKRSVKASMSPAEKTAKKRRMSFTFSRDIDRPVSPLAPTITVTAIQGGRAQDLPESAESSRSGFATQPGPPRKITSVSSSAHLLLLVHRLQPQPAEDLPGAVGRHVRSEVLVEQIEAVGEVE
jgi:hypothetical protein